MIDRDQADAECAVDDGGATCHEDMDAAARRDHLGTLLDEEDRRRRANRGVYRLRQEPRSVHALAAGALLPREGFDHRAVNAAPRSQRRR